ncbi:MAG: hypothetical protein ABR950_10640 [Candidatus Dormibacteria bacterium]
MGFLITACGTTSSSLPGGFRGFRDGNLTDGSVVSLSGTTLVLSTSSGQVTVHFSSSTPISVTSTGSVSDITVGSCITATGSDATGTLTADRVTVSPEVDGSCPASSFSGGNPGGFGGGRPNFTFAPRPSGGFVSDFASVRGVVTAVSDGAVTVLPSGGSSQGITVPSTATVSTTTTGATSDLVSGSCVAAVGPRSSSGVVTASSLLIEPAGPSGCFTGGSGFGGFGGGGFGGGGFGGSGGGGGGTTTTTTTSS